MDGGVERQTGGGIVAGGLVRRQCIAQGTAVADGGIADVIDQGCQHGEVLPQSGRAGDFGVGRARSDEHGAVTELDLPRHDAGEVDQACRCGPLPTLDVAQQRLAAGEQHGTRLAGQAARFVKRGGMVIDEITHHLILSPVGRPPPSVQ